VSPETFAMLPSDVSYAICDGMLGADLLGFHTERWAQLFRETCQAVLGRTPDGVSAFPLGVDADELAERAKRRDVENAVARLADDVGDRLVIGRIDRAELSKNVWRGLLAFRELLRTRPEWRNRVVHAVFDNPSREDLPAYREYAASLERMAAEINDEFSTEEWTPVLLTIAEDYPAALATLRSSDVLFINPLRDGMNLVALEGLVVSDRDPALVLSHEAGAADVLGEDAFLVNPFDVTAMAEALHAALTSSPTERRERAQRMREAATRLPPDRWFQAQLDALDDR
jgi:trehalose 6-phosphate synthase